MSAEIAGEKPWWRWIVLFIVSMLLFGSYYIYDAVTPINDFIQQSMGIGNSQYGLLFTFYSLPNLLFLVVFAGVLLDKIGIRKAGILFAGLCVLGSLITSVAAGSSLTWMLVGRLIYGFGSEAAILVVNKVIAKWFKGKELGFAFGLNITICRLGTVAALNSAAQITGWLGDWRWSVWAGTIVMFITFLLFMVYIAMDRSRELREAGGGEEEKFIVRDILKFGPAFWFISLLCVTFYSAMFPFLAHAPRLLQMKFGMTPAQGGFYASVASASTMLFTPLFGLLVDKRGRRGLLMILGSLLLFPAHLLLGLTGVHPIVPFILMGMAFSLVPAALWPAVPILVRDCYLGTAYGLIGWVQNIGLAAFPWLAGKLVDRSGGDYTSMQVMFASLGFVGLVFSLLLLRADRIHRTGLELPSAEAAKLTCE
jgi:MFS family permease